MFFIRHVLRASFAWPDLLDLDATEKDYVIGHYFDGVSLSTYLSPPAVA